MPVVLLVGVGMVRMETWTSFGLVGLGLDLEAWLGLAWPGQGSSDSGNGELRRTAAAPLGLPRAAAVAAAVLLRPLGGREARLHRRRVLRPMVNVVNGFSFHFLSLVSTLLASVHFAQVKDGNRTSGLVLTTSPSFVSPLLPTDVVTASSSLRR